MYRQQNRAREERGVDLPRNYGGNAFMPFPESVGFAPLRSEAAGRHGDVETEIASDKDALQADVLYGCPRDDGNGESEEKVCAGRRCCDGVKKGELALRRDCDGGSPECLCEARGQCGGRERQKSPHGEKGLLSSDFGIEEILLLGLVILLFSDGGERDNELIACLLLILLL